MVGALQHAPLAVAEDERAVPVRAAVDEGSHRTARAVEHPRLSQQHDAVRLLADLFRAGHRMPAPAQGRVGVGERSDHGATLVRPGRAASRTSEVRRPYSDSGGNRTLVRSQVRTYVPSGDARAPHTGRVTAGAAYGKTLSASTRRDGVDAAAQAVEEHPSSAGPERRGGPLDPRLLRYAHTTRRFLFLAVAIGGVTALLLIAQAWLIAHVVAGAFLDHRSLGSLRDPLLALLAVIAGRSLLAWAAERTAHRASASAKSELRRAAAEHVAALGPRRARGLEGRHAQHAADDRHRRPRRLLRPLPAPAVPGRHRPGGGHRRRGRGGLGQRRADRREPAR